MKKRKLDPKLQAWIDARKRHRLSHAHVQMARELGMNPKTLGKIDNHKQQPWKAPLPDFIEFLYERRLAAAAPRASCRSKHWHARGHARRTRSVGPRPSVGWRGAVPQACRPTARQARGARSHE